MNNPRFTKLLNQLPATVPFVGPETQERERGAVFDARLGANECVFGPSPKAVAAMQAVSSEIWKYADPTSFELRTALAEHHNVDIKNIVVGEGIDGLLGYLARMVVQEGDDIITSDGAYPTFNYHVTGYGGILHKVPYKDDHEDIDGLLEAVIKTNAKLVYFANPDNPMGTVHSSEPVQSFIDRLPSQCLLALDEAYIEFAPDGISPRIDVTQSNVIRFRTFSKGYGMAGARVGYAIGASDVILQFEKIRNHFGMNRAAQAGALAALEDQDWIEHIRNQIKDGRARIGEIAQKNGLSIIPSATNFVAIDCGKDSIFAKVVLSYLVSHGIFVRMPFVTPQDRCIRVSVGLEKDLILFADLLPKALEAARSAG
jgi:histidinol-phosphate aminotransferase